MVHRPHEQRGAREVALRLLERRPLTAEELRRALAQRGFDAAETAATLGRLEREGLVDDAALALHYVTVRAERLGHGKERLLRELVERGIPRAAAERAWAEALHRGSVEPDALLAREVARRLERAGGRLDERACRRVYNALLRAGFDARSIRTHLEPFADFPDEDTDVAAGGMQDDLP